MKTIILVLVLLFSVSLAQAADFTLTWDASSTAGVTYNIYRSEAGVGYSKINTTPIAKNTYTDIGAPYGAVLTYMVTAVVPGVAESGSSNAVVVTTPPPDSLRK